jgi:hypothetical protein
MHRLVSLTFDDGLDSHLENAAPLLERLGMRGTFFVCAGSHSFTRRNKEWQELALRGHELGNHTIFHPARSKGRTWVTPGNALENYSLDRMRLELKAANDWLSAVDGKNERTFAYPCRETVLGRPGLAKRLLYKLGCENSRPARWLTSHPSLDRTSTETDYSCLMPGLFVAARAGKMPETGTAWPPNRFKVPGTPGDGLSFHQLCQASDDAWLRTRWLVLEFHGIGPEGNLWTEEVTLQRFLERLAADPGVKCMTFIDAAREIFGGPLRSK